MKHVFLSFLFCIVCVGVFSQSLIVDVGSANNYQITYPANFSGGAPPAGFMVTFKAINNNTGISTLKLNSFSAYTIKRNSNVDLTANDIKAQSFVTVIYDGTNWQMLSISNNPTLGGQWNNNGSDIYFNTGNVGIGNNAPTSALAVNGAITVDNANTNDGTSGTFGTSALRLGNTNSIGISSKKTATGNQNGMDFWTGSSTRMQIYNGGNISFGGNFAPTALLHQDPLSNTATYHKFTNNNTLQTATDGTSIGIDVSGNTEIRNYELTNINFFTNNLQQMTILSNGNVGIGIGAPGERLVVSGSVSATGIGYFGTIIGNNLNGPNGSLITVNGTGRLGVGPLPNFVGGSGQTNGIAYFLGSNIITSNGANLNYNGQSINYNGARFFTTTTGGNSSVYLGNGAGNFSASGTDNNFIGYLTGTSSTSGGFNNFFGNSAGLSNTTGFYNNFIGHRAGYANTTGVQNNFFGVFAGTANVSGSTNVFIGASAGNVNNVGSDNNFIGNNTGSGNTSGTGNNFIGTNAGGTNTTGTYNIALGFNSNLGSANLTNAIAIGYTASVTNSNSMALGGVGANAVSVGINSSSPAARLDVGGNTIGALQAILARGNPDANFQLQASNGNGATLMTKFGLNYSGSIDNASINFYRGASNNDGFLAFSTFATDRLTILSNGRVGVGTTTPSSTLDINGSISRSIVTTSTNITLNDTHYTVILTNNGLTITIPSAATCIGRVYVILSRPILAGNTLTISYIDFDGSSSTAIPNRNPITIQSDGTVWNRIQ